MIRELLYKWFGLEPLQCESCETLRAMLAESNYERKDLLNRLLNPVQPSVEPVKEEEYRPIKPAFMPWHVRQEILEAEDRKQAQLLKDKEKEISDLEKELGVAKDVSAPSGGVMVR